MEELRGTIRPGDEGPWNTPCKPANLLLDDLNKLRVMRTRTRYKSYPESHHIEEEERR